MQTRSFCFLLQLVRLAHIVSSHQREAAIVQQRLVLVQRDVDTIAGVRAARSKAAVSHRRSKVELVLHNAFVTAESG